MTKMTKFLALLPVVAFAVGCSGVAPSGPSAVASNDANDSGSVSASRVKSSDCSSLSDLILDDSDDSMLYVKASYYFSSPILASCVAPIFTSDHEGLTVDKANHFRAGFFRLAGGLATVKAVGPNGVHNAITIDLGPAPAHRIPSPTECPSVTGVTLSLKPSSDTTRVAIVAAYLYGGPDSTPCGFAPAWLADRPGLTVDLKTPFEASIASSVDVATIVRATAPNGAAGKISF